MNKIIKEKGEFEEVSRLISNVFYEEKCLPDQVFKSSFRNTVVLDFDHLMSYSFWSELEHLTNIFDESHIITAVLDPHPVNYYYKEFSYYNWCIFNKETTAAEYWDNLQQSPTDSPADSMSIHSNVVVWLPSSMKWALWGERNYGIGILKFNDDMGDYSSESWFTMDQAIIDLVSLNFKDYTVPKDIESKLIKHYSPGK